MTWDRKTTFDQAADEGLEDALENNPSVWGPLVVQVRRRLRERYYDQDVVDAVGQNGSYSYSFVDAYIFARVWGGDWMSGKIGSMVVSAGEPGPDKEIQRNQETLDANLHEFFRAKVNPGRGGAANHDGSLSWTQPITLNRIISDADGVKQTIPWECAPETIPLEIGTTKMARTFFHLRMYGALARWPYGHDHITIMKFYPRRPNLLDGIDAK